MRLTNSEMKTLRRCKRKWWLSYYRGLAPTRQPSPLAPIKIGSWVHDALAAYYERGEDPVAYLEAGRAARVVAAEDPREADRAESLCVAMVEGYLDWLEETGADSEMRVVGAERAAEAPLGDALPGVTLLAKLDAVVEHKPTDQKLAFEFKTVSDLSTPKELLRLDTQFLTEHLVRFLLQLEAGQTAEEAINDCSGVLWRGLRRVKRTASAKPPFYGEEIVPHNADELRNHWRHVVAWAREIQGLRARLDAGESHQSAAPPNPEKSCKWECEFFRLCPMFDDGSRVEDALAQHYVQVDPLERYQGAVEM